LKADIIFLPALGHDKAQNIIDQITQAYESGTGPPPGGFGFTAASLGEQSRDRHSSTTADAGKWLFKQGPLCLPMVRLSLVRYEIRPRVLRLSLFPFTCAGPPPAFNPMMMSGPRYMGASF